MGSELGAKKSRVFPKAVSQNVEVFVLKELKRGKTNKIVLECIRLLTCSATWPNLDHLQHENASCKWHASVEGTIFRTISLTSPFYLYFNASASVFHDGIATFPQIKDLSTFSTTADSKEETTFG